MVQFSLKLEDNRVDKWSAQYLDYRKLKKAIKHLAFTRKTAAIIANRWVLPLFGESTKMWFEHVRMGLTIRIRGDLFCASAEVLDKPCTTAVPTALNGSSRGGEWK